MKKPQLLQHKIAASLAWLALLLFGSSASATLTVTTTNQQGSASSYPFTPTWTQASGSLIAGLAPSTAVGNFTNDLSTRNVATLTSGWQPCHYYVAGRSGTGPGWEYHDLGKLCKLRQKWWHTADLHVADIGHLRIQSHQHYRLWRLG